MKSGLTIRKDAFDDFKSSLKKLAKTDVLVGIPSDRAERGDGMEINNAELGYLQSYGGTIRIPAHDITIHRQVDKNGDLRNNGQFVKAKKANLATIHHVNAYTVTLPARPFLDMGIKDSQEKTTGLLKEAGRAILAGDDSTGAKLMNQAGQIAADAARNVIASGDQLKPLEPSTLSSRRSQGRTGTKPLLVTGSLMRSITYVVRIK